MKKPNARSYDLVARILSGCDAAGQRGQVLAMVAVFIVGLLAMMALVFDGGAMYLQRRQMQNAADAGALAGARAVCMELSAAEAEAAGQEYAGANGAQTAQVAINNNPDGATVVACADVPMTFAQVIGIGTVNVCARASAACAAVNPLGGVKPVGIPFEEYYHCDDGVYYTIWDDERDHSTEGEDNISGRGWLNLDELSDTGTGSCPGAGTSTLSYWMGAGYPGFIPLDVWVCKESGTIAALLIHTVNVGDVLPIICYDELSPDGWYHIEMFAAFLVTAVNKTGGDKYITGCFLNRVESGKPSPGSKGDWVTPYLTE